MQYLKDNIKSWIRGSERYKVWCEEIGPEIHKQCQYWQEKYAADIECFPLDNVSIKCTYYFADNTMLDLINKDESVFDMLVKQGVISDDNYGVLHKTASEGYCCKGEIVQNICVVDVTYMIF
jgi:hypothetical protein